MRFGERTVSCARSRRGRCQGCSRDSVRSSRADTAHVRSRPVREGRQAVASRLILALTAGRGSSLSPRCCRVGAREPEQFYLVVLSFVTGTCRRLEKQTCDG